MGAELTAGVAAQQGLDLLELETELCRADAVHSELLANLHIPLLRGLAKRQPAAITSETWPIHLAKVGRRAAGGSVPLISCKMPFALSRANLRSLPRHAGAL